MAYFNAEEGIRKYSKHHKEEMVPYLNESMTVGTVLKLYESQVSELEENIKIMQDKLYSRYVKAVLPLGIGFLIVVFLCIYGLYI